MNAAINSLVSFFQSISRLIDHILSSILHLFALLFQVIDLATLGLSFLPSFLLAVALACFAILVLRLVIGR